MGRRIVVTGIGAVTPIGIGKEAYFAGLRTAKNGISRITQFEPEPFTSQMAGELKDFNAPIIWIVKTPAGWIGFASML